jgi:MFS family permease
MTTDATSAPSAARIRLSLLGVLFGMLLSMLDNFIVGTAMPTIVRDLGGVSLLSWVVTAYTLATAVSTPIWGKLGDLYGRKIMFQLAVTGFVAGSVLAALAPSMGLLIAARAFQGLAAGGLAVGAFAVIGDLVPPRERGKYQGMVAVVVATGTIGGPLVGGFITDGFGWRWAFLINLPLGALTLLWVGFLLKLPASRRHARIDWLGAILLSGAISATVLLTTWAGSAFAWASLPSAGLSLTAVACLAVFIWQERHNPEPLLPWASSRTAASPWPPPSPPSPELCPSPACSIYRYSCKPCRPRRPAALGCCCSP